MAHEEVGGYENLLDKYSKAVPDPEFAAFQMVDGINQVHNLLTLLIVKLIFRQSWILRPEIDFIFLVLQ